MAPVAGIAPTSPAWKAVVHLSTPHWRGGVTGSRVRISALRLQLTAVVTITSQLNWTQRRDFHPHIPVLRTGPWMFWHAAFGEGVGIRTLLCGLKARYIAVYVSPPKLRVESAALSTPDWQTGALLSRHTREMVTSAGAAPAPQPREGCVLAARRRGRRNDADCTRDLMLPQHALCF